MTTKTWYFLTTTAVTPNWYGALQDGGSAPTAANTAFGWGVAKTSTATPYYAAAIGATATVTTSQAGSVIASKTGPTKGTGSGNTTAGDSFVAGPYTGTFAAGAWTLSPMIRAGTAGAVGHLNMRVWRSANADGSSAIELTSGSLVGTAVTLSTSADVNGLGTTTWSPGALTLNNEYIFFQFEWQETTAGSSNNDNIFFRAGTALITSPNFAAVWAGNATLTPAGGLVIPGNLQFAAAAALAPNSILLGNARTYIFDLAETLSVNSILLGNVATYIFDLAETLSAEDILTANATILSGTAGTQWSDSSGVAGASNVAVTEQQVLSIGALM